MGSMLRLLAWMGDDVGVLAFLTRLKVMKDFKIKVGDENLLSGWETAKGEFLNTRFVNITL
jgi:hypothetical protein